MNTRVEAASERTQNPTSPTPWELSPLPCRYRSLESLLDAAAEAAEARARAEARAQTPLPFARQR